MDGHPHLAVRTSFSLLLVILFGTSTAQICTAPPSVRFPENNTVGAVVVTITTDPGVTLAFAEPPANPDNPFALQGNDLVAARVLDYETIPAYSVAIICSHPSSPDTPLSIPVFVLNVNEHGPVFAQSSYDLNVDELTPVGSSVGRYTATDGDNDQIFYSLTSTNNAFRLSSTTVPIILVEKLLAYHQVQSDVLTLTARDSLFSASTTILVRVLDVDNRPPWFQPCSQTEVGTVVICPSGGYTGKVTLNEQMPGILALKPGPLYAIDGDAGINEEMTYSFVSGNDGGVFAINPNTGNITMTKVADAIGTIALTVMAAQKTNTFQFATTSVTVSVQAKSLHKPEFQRPSYAAAVTTVGAMATDPTSGEPLQIIATDDDYAATGGLNPDIVYSIDGTSDFAVIGSFLFMMKDLPETTYSLTVIATDTSNDEVATAPISVTVTGPTTTLPPTTTNSQTTTSVTESTTDSKTTDWTTPPTSTDSTLSTTTSGTTSQSVATTNPTITSESVSTTVPTMTSERITTTNPTVTSERSTTTNPTVTSERITTTITSEGSISTINPSLTSEGSDSTTNTAHTVPAPPGGYGPADMAALGATLGVLLFISLVAIAVLAVCIRRWKADWKKIYEANMFQSSLGPSGQKGNIQYTNEAFQTDEDGASTGSSGLLVANVLADNFMLTEDLKKSSAAWQKFPGDDNASQGGSDTADSEKGVKPILMKERRMDDGYKSVWFKEDIDPNAKQEVVIIPDSREDDSEDEEPSSSGREDEEDGDGRGKTSRAVVNEADLDSGLGEKIEDPSEDSEVDETLAVQL